MKYSRPHPVLFIIYWWVNLVFSYKTTAIITILCFGNVQIKIEIDSSLKKSDTVSLSETLTGM